MCIRHWNDLNTTRYSDKMKWSVVDRYQNVTQANKNTTLNTCTRTHNNQVWEWRKTHWHYWGNYIISARLCSSVKFKLNTQKVYSPTLGVMPPSIRLEQSSIRPAPVSTVKRFLFLLPSMTVKLLWWQRDAGIKLIIILIGNCTSPFCVYCGLDWIHTYLHQEAFSHPAKGEQKQVFLFNSLI